MEVLPLAGLQNNGTFDMGGLGEKVGSLYPGEAISSLLAKDFKIPGEGRGLATYIKQGFRSGRTESIDNAAIAAFSGRI